MIIQSKKVFIDDKFEERQIEVIGNKITNIYPYNKEKVDIDYIDKRIVPGFIDVHCHGYGGYDTNDATQDGMKKWLTDVTSEGVTALCPTTITQSNEVLTKAVKNVAAVKKQNPEGAEILGIHFEGPYISKEFKGAQPEEYIVKPNIEEFKQYQKDAKGLIRIITIAPEEDDNYELIKYCVANGVNVSLGHSAATYKQAQDAIELGATCFTHTYNGMSRFNHRDNNLVGAALGSDIFAECICDGHHSTFNSLRIFFRCKGKNGIMMSDGLMTKGLPVGTRMLFGGQEIEMKDDDTCRLTSTGNFAGSILRLNIGLKNLVEEVGIPFEIALSSCTSAPARYLKIDNHKGYIKQGYDADIVVLDDNYDVLATFARGKLFNYE